jgi:glycosyltransferase involved in cell wall biosynthesis
MRVLIFHGYLLRGTGSNVYNASLAQALARLGHEVHLLCQDRAAGALEWVTAVGTWGPRGLEVAAGAGEGGSRQGSVTAYLPEIGGLLPVYVRDEYEGFRVKTFAELTAEELDAYIDANVAAVRDVVEHAGGIDAALANHLVMGPVVLARADLRYALKVHGSDLSYTVLPQIERFGPYASEAVEGAAGVLVGSVHIAERLRAAVGDAADAKLRAGPPGVDTELFALVEPAAAPERLRGLAAELRGEGDASGTWGRDPHRAAVAVSELAAAAPRVVFVGKLIVSKGIDLLLSAWPLVHAQNPTARLLVVGFGEYEAGLRALLEALERGDVDGMHEVAARGRGLEGGEERPLAILAAFLADPPPGYAEAARAAAGSVLFAGRLEHEEVGRLVPATDALVFPSTFPEAFGMVAAEAAAAGVLPVSAAHSGALEVSRELAAALSDEIAPLVSFAVDEAAVEAIAARLNAWLALGEAERRHAGEALRGTAARLWSWQGVARGVLAASAGHLDELPTVER